MFFRKNFYVHIFALNNVFYFSYVALFVDQAVPVIVGWWGMFGGALQTLSPLRFNIFATQVK